MTRTTQPGFDRQRDKAGCEALLECFQSLPRDLTEPQCPSSLDLILDGRFGQRPVNRLNDLVRGKFDGHRYDFERIPCGRGVYRWRLHEPNRPGYPKHKGQSVLPLPATGPARPIQSPYMQRIAKEAAEACPLFANGGQP